MSAPRQFPDDSTGSGIAAPDKAHPFGSKTAADTAAERTAGLTDSPAPEMAEESDATAHAIAGNEEKASAGNVMAEDTQPVVQAVRRAWRYRIDAAKALWIRLTEREVLKPELARQRPAGVIRQRHHISLDKARQQLKDFFVSPKS